MIRRLAVGGMGEIFLARQAIAGANRLVVLKRLLPGMAEDAQLLAMFVDEARIAANLAHPGIVQVYEFGEDATGHFIVMEYVPGHHLGQVIARAERVNRPVPVRLGAYIVSELARAVDHAHRARDSAGAPLEIVHRDISPSNVLVSHHGDVKLMDFGVARATNRGHQTNDGSIRGKFAYMAPEQIEAKHVDARTDVFALGVVLWELTLGKRLFTGPSDFEVIRAALEQPIPRPSSIDPYYPPAVEALVMAALERDQDRRLASAAELAAGLRAYLKTSPTDRDDVAAFMAELYPGEAAESDALAEEHTKARPVEAATVLLPGAAKAEPTAEPTRRRSRLGVVLFLLLLGTCAGLGYVVYTRVTRSSAPPTIDAPVAMDAPISAPIAAPIDAPMAVTVDAPVPAVDAAARIDGRPDRVDARPGRDARPPVDAVIAQPPPTHPDAALQLGTISFHNSETASIFLKGDNCKTKSVPAVCKDLVVGTSHTFTFTVGTAAFDKTLTVKPGTTKCEVTPSTRTVTCR